MESGSYTCLGETDTTFKGVPCETDLMTFDQHSRIVTTNFFQHSCSMYKYDEGKVTFEKDLNYQAGGPVHGVKFYTPDILAITSRREAAGIHFFEASTGKIVRVIATPGKSVQDIQFLSPQRVVMISTTDSPKMQSGKMWNSILDVIDFDLEGKQAKLVYSRNYADAHLDSIVIHQNRLYMTDQYNHKVIVLSAENLEPVEEHHNYHFPHGIDVNHGMLAVTNYGLNTVEIRKLSH